MQIHLNMIAQSVEGHAVILLDGAGWHSAIIYTLIETAKLNDINPVKYLHKVFDVIQEFLISERETAKFDLMISAQVTSKGLDIRFEYATDLFTCSTIQNIATCFEALLSNMIIS